MTANQSVPIRLGDIASRVGHGGVNLALEQRAGTLPGWVLWSHATGFCKETWYPVLNHAEGVPSVLVDQRGHGDSELGPAPLDWWDLGRDLAAISAGFGKESPRLGVGHSSGATALIMAELLRPGTFDRLVLIEPVVFFEPSFSVDDMVETARRRRSRFTSHADAIDRFTGRGPFAAWVSEALDAYVHHGLRPRPEGGFELKCDPEVEADFYRAGSTHGTWDRLGEVGCPVTLIAGAKSSTHGEAFAREQAGRFPASDLRFVPDAGHFVPMERPELIAEAVLESWDTRR